MGEVSSDGGCLLQAVAGEAIGEVEAFQFGPFAEEGVPVEGVDGVETGPGPDEPERFPGGDDGGELGPKGFDEIIFVPGKIEADRADVG